MTEAAPQYRLQRKEFADLPGWQDDDPSALFHGMRACLRQIRDVKPYKTGALGLTAAELADFIEKAPAGDLDAATAREFFEAHATPFLVDRTDGNQGFVTAFYEPEIEVSPTRDEVWKYPFYRRPPDLVDLDDRNRPPGLDPSYMFGRKTADGITTYADRREIDEGFLEGQGLEIAYARSKVDVFFVHVQGAARLRYPDGAIRRITYAAKAGHPFSAIGKLLIDRGELDPATVSMQTIRAWLASNPAKVDEVLWHNRSYIFFRDAEVTDPALGPIAAAKVPLIPGRSLAVDRQIHTFGFPFFIHSETLTHLDNGKPFARLMLALDTGSAIVGPARGDIFTGSGDAAGERAGTVRNAADFYILIPNTAAGRYGA
ncbi:murein transglycosylase A [Rhizobium sp. NTR19]|uniref:peptidoglycan lytic exotransglycosylase n=1 Tax=Neorhizobium turbinariae TaxID=2937795 RepID=A0ABT0IVD4_9HYPH|nr:murein transglycosylase A [Neorhizobium turbinariae]MCK8781819.1 murein transglycosylase A [Neorhizobium turbinariae]